MLVIDTGTAGNAKKIVAYIQKIGRQTFEGSTIILTHYHMDHVGNAKDLKGITKAKVAVHLEDADFVAGKSLFQSQKHSLPSSFILHQAYTRRG
jgi:hydroxyacylglutathione hydrolase